MNKHELVFYPVANGDTSQVILTKGRRILFDYCHRSNNPFIDLKKHLTDELNAANRDYFDVVAFTHADKDHISGCTEFFEFRHAQKYQGNGRIKINELWVPAAIVLDSATNDEQSEEFVILRQEARYRLIEGNGIRVFSHPKSLDDDWLHPKLKELNLPVTARDHLFVDAGQLVPGLTLGQDGVEVFCHSPFIKHCDDGDIIRNEAALILNVRLDIDGSIFDFLEVGDSTWDVLEDVVTTTRVHKNMDRLKWDVYNIPHHCSYLALSDDKGEKETTPKPLVKEILLAGKPGSYIVSSSNPVPDIKESYTQVQPPHIQARKTYENYIDKIGGRKFLVTMEEPNANQPEPIRFEFSCNGISLIKAATTGAMFLSSTKPPRAG